MSENFDPLKRHREFMSAIDPLRPYRQALAAMDVLRKQRETMAALDTLTQQRAAMAALDPLRQQRQIAAALDPLKQYREIAAALDPMRQYRVAAEALSQATARNLVVDAASFVPETAEQALRDLQASMDEDDSVDDGRTLPEWLELIPTIRQRRVFLAAMTALWAITDAADSYADVTPPAHLDKLVLALIAIVAWLNEISERPNDL